jgi:hypothetical protein
MKKEAITLLGVGDILIDRDNPDTLFQYVADVLRSGDITFANCEQVYSDKVKRMKEIASYSDPRNIPALINAGIDIISLANNHTLDCGQEALLDTIVRLKEAGLPYIGVGKNISEARQPVILERKGTRIGFLAYCCIGPDGYEAGENKPGFAPVRSWTLYQQVDPQPGTPPRIISVPYTNDLAAMVEDIKKLKAQVDLTVVSYHWGQHFLPRVIPMYCFDIGHAAVDAGADLILGTHAHMLKGIEVYKGAVIFYSTGNFAIELGPGTIIGKTPIEALKGIQKLYKFTPDPEYTTSPCHPEAKHTLIVRAVIENGMIKRVSYIPCFVNKRAEPEILTRRDPRSQAVFDYMTDISRSEGLNVHFSWDGDEVAILP